MFVLGLFVGIIVGIIIGILLLSDNKIVKKYISNNIPQKKIPIKQGHLKPSKIGYDSYDGGFVYVTVCSHCGTTGREREQTEYEPCNKCGHKIYNKPNGEYGEQKYTAKWIFFNDEWQWVSTLDYSNMSEEEVTKKTRERKFNRIFDGKTK